MSSNVPMRQVYNDFLKVIGRAAFRRERMVVMHRGQPYMAIIPIEDLKLLEAIDKADGSVRRRRRPRSRT